MQNLKVVFSDLQKGDHLANLQHQRILTNLIETKQDARYAPR